MSDDGSLFYVSVLTPPDPDRILALVDREGEIEPLDLEPAQHLSPRLSPDETMLAVEVADGLASSVWIYDLAGDNDPRELTLEGDSRRPVWTPDSSMVTFQSDRDDTMSVYWALPDRSLPAERLTTADVGTSHFPESWSPNGRVLAFSIADEGRGRDLWTFSLDTRTSELFEDLDVEDIKGPVFSPDGEWIAYGANDSSQSAELRVQPFPAGEYHRIATPGQWPFWSPDGGQVFYLPATDDELRIARDEGEASDITRMAVRDFRTEPTVGWSAERVLPVAGFFPSPHHRNWDMHPDGERFIVATLEDPNVRRERPQINVVLSWHEELLERVPIP